MTEEEYEEIVAKLEDDGHNVAADAMTAMYNMYRMLVDLGVFEQEAEFDVDRITEAFERISNQVNASVIFLSRTGSVGVNSLRQLAKQFLNLPDKKVGLTLSKAFSDLADRTERIIIVENTKHIAEELAANKKSP